MTKLHHLEISDRRTGKTTRMLRDIHGFLRHDRDRLAIVYGRLSDASQMLSRLGMPHPQDLEQVFIADDFIAIRTMSSSGRPFRFYVDDFMMPLDWEYIKEWFLPEHGKDTYVCMGIDPGAGALPSVANDLLAMRMPFTSYVYDFRMPDDDGRPIPCNAEICGRCPLRKIDVPSCYDASSIRRLQGWCDAEGKFHPCRQSVMNARWLAMPKRAGCMYHHPWMAPAGSEGCPYWFEHILSSIYDDDAQDGKHLDSDDRVAEVMKFECDNRGDIKAMPHIEQSRQ